MASTIKNTLKTKQFSEQRSQIFCPWNSMSICLYWTASKFFIKNINSLFFLEGNSLNSEDLRLSWVSALNLEESYLFCHLPMKHCNPYKTKPEPIRDGGQKGHREGFHWLRNIKDIYEYYRKWDLLVIQKYLYVTSMIHLRKDGRADCGPSD